MQFVNRTKDWGLNIPSFSNGASFVDLDLDGDLDYVVNNINDPAFIYRNNSVENFKESSNYLRINLKGEASNVAAIGASVELWSKGHYQYAEKFLSRGYISSVDPIMHFGLGNINEVDSLRITWPSSKKVTNLKSIRVNQVITLKESDAIASVVKPHVSKTQKIFTKVEDVVDFTHIENDYIDFF
ncbi:MAG: ASPIC/UnbV domain-containing protein [Cytophagales bacterium]|nr:ASPIC/UnbV domain-containing protein [Cytophagales bacterium]